VKKKIPRQKALAKFVQYDIELKGLSHEILGGYLLLNINQKLFSRAIDTHHKILILLKDTLQFTKEEKI